MSSQEENLVTVREALEAFQGGDPERFLGFLDPEIEIFSTPELANPVEAQGRDAFLRWIGDWLEVWETFEVDAESIEPVGENHVVLDMRQHGKGKGSGIEVELRVSYMFELHDGVATRYHLYADRKQALAAAREGESKAGEALVPARRSRYHRH
jgi:ketosteroid isomerase-like protein